jgi:glutamyl/glutaminyl-tRNA synthetase
VTNCISITGSKNEIRRKLPSVCISSWWEFFYYVAVSSMLKAGKQQLCKCTDFIKKNKKRENRPNLCYNRKCRSDSLPDCRPPLAVERGPAMRYGIVLMSRNELLCDSRTNEPVTFADKELAWNVIRDYKSSGMDMVVVDIAEWKKLCRETALMPGWQL